MIPDWKSKGAPLTAHVTDDKFYVLTETSHYEIPHALLPPLMSNKGNYAISLGNLCRWLATQAEALGVEIFPGFAATEVLYDDKGHVKGVATGDMGVGRDGEHKAAYQPGMELHGKYVLFGEGARGSLSKGLMQKFNLRDGVDPQKFGIGIKELWQIDPAKHKQGLVLHTQGWPLDNATVGGSFMYHLEDGVRVDRLRCAAQATRIRICRRSTNSSASNITRRSSRISKAASVFRTARARSRRAGCNRSRI